MPKSKQPHGSDIQAWIDSLEFTAIDKRKTILRFVKNQTLAAYKAEDPLILPGVVDISKTIGLSRPQTQSLSVGLVEDGILGRIKTGSVFRYYTTSEWLT